MGFENKAVQIVSDFLAASMAPDPVLAATFMADDVRITFTGGRAMPSAHEITAFNAGRYNWVKKQLGQFDWTEHADHTVVYSNGTPVRRMAGRTHLQWQPLSRPFRGAGRQDHPHGRLE